MRERSVALAQLQDRPPAPDNREQIRDAFANWSLEHFQVFAPVANTSFLTHCAYGQQTAERTIQWLSQLRWPTDQRGPQGHETGTAWIELALSWMLYNQAFIPVLRAADSGGKRVIVPGSTASAHELQVTLAELGTNLSAVVDNVAALVPEALTPKLHRRKCKSLYVQGCLRHTQGIVGRLCFPFQREVADVLHGLFRDNSNGHQLRTPDVISISVQNVSLEGSFDFRTREAKKRMFSVRRLRRLA